MRFTPAADDFLQRSRRPSRDILRESAYIAFTTTQMLFSELSGFIRTFDDTAQLHSKPLIVGALGGRHLTASAARDEARRFSPLFGSSSPKVTKNPNSDQSYSLSAVTMQLNPGRRLKTKRHHSGI